jgi:hypothetical protein
MFLDISNFLALGFSYSKYLAAYKIEETKGFFFANDYMTDFKKLNEKVTSP